MAMSELEKSLNKLTKNFKESFADIGSAGFIKYYKLRSPALNYVFGGHGYAEGRITELSGLEGAGKTTLATIIASEIQLRKTKNKVLFVDFEYAYDLNHAQELGLDISDAVKDPKNGKFIFLRPTQGEDAFTIIQELVQTGDIGLVVWDSVAASPTADQVENEYGKKDFGNVAKLFSTGLRKLNPWLVRTETPLILINQLRDNQNAGMYGDPYVTMGGRAIKHYTSTRFRVTRSEDILEDGDMVGIKIKIKNQKNKTGVPKREAFFNILFGEGLQVDPEYVDLATELKIIKKSGSWYKHEETAMAVQGADGVLAFFKDKPEAWHQIKNTVDALIAQKNDLDVEREAAEGSGFDLAEED
jgi:recombination protein RecA